MKIKKDSFLKYIIFTSKASMVFVLSITLISIGILIFSFFSLQKGINLLQENIPAKIVLKSEYSESDILALNNYLESNLKHIQSKPILFVSKKEGLDKMYTLLGDDLKEFFSEDNSVQNPLPDIQNIYLISKYHNSTYLSYIEKEIEENFACVSYFEPPINIVIINTYKDNILVASIIFSLIFFMISILLIYNNIKLSIYNNKINIKAMQLVGATKSFIQAPFLKKSVLIGIQSGVIALIFLGFFLYICFFYFPTLKVLMNYHEIIQLCLVILFLGILISFISTFIALRKLTSLKTDIYE
mgnify:CR=1 FL=1